MIAQRASGAVHTLPGEGGTARRIGVIEWPSFYGSQEAGGSSVTADVAELLATMTSAGIDGIVVDLRDNPGGSMGEAVKLCGLFLRGGTAAHSRAQSGEAHAFEIEPAAGVYDGPMVVLTNPESASASELFSGAMRFHRRAIVMGGETTRGKGTVQNFIQLDRSQNLATQRDWGTLRLTHSTFHLPDGGPIQRSGIPSDIVLPLKAAPGSKRESELEHALPATTLASAKPESPPGGARIPVDGALLESLARSARENTEFLPEWKLWLEMERHYAPRPEDAPVDMDIEVRRARWEKWKSEGESLANRWNELVRTGRHAIEPVDIAPTREARAAHDERLRDRLEGRIPDPIARLEGGGIVVETAHGHLRRLRWTSFPFHRYTALAAELAAAFNAGAGTEMGSDKIGLIISELQLIEHLGDEAARAVFARHAPEITTPEAIHAGIDTVLARIVELDPNLRAERRVLDVPLREAVRAAAAWSVSETGATAP
jgi:carboxyl-terminal processing protease